MESFVELSGKLIKVVLSHSAQVALEQRKHHLCLEMELNFSCMIKKRVSVRPAIDNGMSVFVNDMLEIGFRPVIGGVCGSGETRMGVVQAHEHSIVNAERYIPDWLHIDYKKNRWCSEFGYCGQV